MLEGRIESEIQYFNQKSDDKSKELAAIKAKMNQNNRLMTKANKSQKLGKTALFSKPAQHPAKSKRVSRSKSKMSAVSFQSKGSLFSPRQNDEN